MLPYVVGSLILVFGPAVKAQTDDASLIRACTRAARELASARKLITAMNNERALLELKLSETLKREDALRLQVQANNAVNARLTMEAQRERARADSLNLDLDRIRKSLAEKDAEVVRLKAELDRLRIELAAARAAQQQQAQTQTATTRVKHSHKGWWAVLGIAATIIILLGATH